MQTDETFEKYRRIIQACVEDSCPLANEIFTPTPGCGSLTSDVIFVGRNPGSQEEFESIPFVGPAGQELDRWFEFVGLRRDEVFLTNIVKCHTHKNEVPSQKAVKVCATKFLRVELRLIQPRLIVTLGRFVTEAFLPAHKFGAISLTGIEVPSYRRGDTLIMPIVHPGGVLPHRSPQFRESALLRMKAVKTYIEETDEAIEETDTEAD